MCTTSDLLSEGWSMEKQTLQRGKAGQERPSSLPRTTRFCSDSTEGNHTQQSAPGCGACICIVSLSFKFTNASHH